MIQIEEFCGSRRFALRCCLGSGSFGKVYEAYDRDQECRVALKIPHSFQAVDLFRLKQEFRALADVSHPNLVALRELMTDGNRWFFSMELLDGVDFLTALRRGVPGAEGAALTGSSGTLVALRRVTDATCSPLHGSTGEDAWGGVEPVMHPRTYPCSPPREFQVIRKALVDLVHGLGALHAAGIIHRDLKPGNVIITPQGRLVILDFGLATRLLPEGSERPETAGTPAFIAPEILEGGECSPASDWYSVGVMLYQVLTGQPPYIGTDLEVIRAKADMDPCPPSLLVEGLPEDLDHICTALLERDPALRPDGAAILEALQGDSREGRPPRVLRGEMIGREAELAMLLRSFHQLRDGCTRTVWLQGESGSGKTALVQRFVREVRRLNPECVVLPGRCYEQEDLPFKAMDSLVDALSLRLKAMAPLACRAILPRQTASLVQLFPVLGQVPALAEAPGAPLTVDPVELRRQAFAAFRELLERLGNTQPLVLILEDLQWGDMDSAALLAELFRGPDRPCLMLVITFRGEDLSSSPVLRQLCSSPAELFGELVSIELHSLGPREARAMALSRLDPLLAGREGLAERIARDSGGNPYYIHELAHFLRGAQEPARDWSGGLEAYLQGVIRGLPEDAKLLLETLALAGRPLPWSLARAATERKGGGESGYPQLRSAHLVRVRGAQEDKLLEPYHHRVQLAVLAAMDPGEQALGHLRLARAMEERGGQEPAFLALHYKRGGDSDRALGYYIEGAHQAGRALAFEQAASFLAQAMALLGDPWQTRRDLCLDYADALCKAGHSLEAAEAYQRLIPGAPTGREGILLRRRASEEFMRCGHMDRGVVLLEELLPLARIRMPASPGHALVRALGLRVLLRLRGLRYERREEGGIPREDLDRIDLLWAAAMGFGPVDPIPATLFQVKQLLLVLHAGEPYRLVRALAHEAVFLSHRGLRSERETGRVLSLALEEAERLGQPEPLGRAYIGAGIAAILQGRWKAGAGLLDRAEHLLREGTAGLHYEIHLAQFQALVGYSVMGDLPELSRRLPGLVLEARSKGDLLALANLRAGHAYLLFLAQDRPEMAREALVEAMGAWSSRGFHAQHYNELVSLVNIELYEGSPLRARAQLEAAWSALRRSMLLRVQAIGITCRELRARTLLGLELEKPGSMDARGWRQLGSDIRAIEAEKTPYGHALVLRLQGLALLARGREGEAHPVLLQSELAFEGSDMRLHALTVRMLRGSLHGRAGEGLREAARTDLQALGVVSPERFLRMHLPVPRPQ